MIYSEDGYIVDLSTSCNKDVAVAKLLGWMKGPVYESYPSPDLLLELQSMDRSLQDVLSHLRDIASQEYRDVDEKYNLADLELDATAESDAKIKEYDEKESAYYDLLFCIEKAFKYKLEIEEELSKGETSKLKIDHETSKRTGTTHITLRSVHQWAKQKYDISILEDQSLHVSSEETQLHPITHAINEDLNPMHGFSPTVATNFLTTFAFLVKAFSKTAEKYGGDKPNVTAIAECIHELAADANKGETMDNQSVSVIKKRIKQALDEK